MPKKDCEHYSFCIDEKPISDKTLNSSRNGPIDNIKIKAILVATNIRNARFLARVVLGSRVHGLLEKLGKRFSEAWMTAIVTKT